MARRTRQQIQADRVIKKRLNELGETIYQEARETSRIDTGQLVNSINYMVKPDTTLSMFQVFYGKYHTPKGVDSGPKNALAIAVENHVDETTKVIVKDITDLLLKPFKEKRK